VPPNWSPQDWREEMEAEVSAAAWEAERDFDPARGVPPEDFVRRRVLSRALRRYRREWAYARRCGLHLEGDDRGDATADGLASVEASDSLRCYLRRLPEIQRRLIEGLYLEEKTQVELAQILSLSQSTISKCKRRALEQLRIWMGPADKASLCRFLE
jgi:RNA polymerase sigma factor (sigma-70 family)